MGGGGANLVSRFGLLSVRKLPLPIHMKIWNLFYVLCTVSYDCACFKCSANIIVPVHATNSIGVSTGSTFVVIGWRTANCSVLGCLCRKVDVAGVFIVYRWIYAHTNFVWQVFWEIMMGMGSFIDHLVLLSTLLTVLFKTGKFWDIFVFSVSYSVKTW